MTSTTLNAAKPMAAQASASDKIWDVLLKLTVAAAVALSAAVFNHDTRLTRNEVGIHQNAKDVARVDSKVDSLSVQLLQRLDRLIASIDALGNRMTRIETKLENR